MGIRISIIYQKKKEARSIRHPERNIEADQVNTRMVGEEILDRLLVEVHRHLDVLLLEPTLLVEPAILRRTVEDHLVATRCPSVADEVPDHGLPQTPSPGGGVDDHVLDVADFAASPEKLLLHEDAPRGDDPPRLLVFHHDDRVVVAVGGELREPGEELLVRDGAAGAELGEELHKAFGLVRRL